MTKQTQDERERVSALENELRVMREQHAAELQALRDEIRNARAVAKEAEIEIPAGASPEERQQLERLQNERLLYAMSPVEYERAMSKKSNEWLKGHHDRTTVAPWRELLSGQFGFLLVTETAPTESFDGRAKPMTATTAAVFADGPSVEMAAHVAYGKYGKFSGWGRPHSYYQQVALSPEDAECIRADLLAMLESGANQYAITQRCVGYLARHRQAKLAREAAELRGRAEVAPAELPDRFQHSLEGRRAGIDSAYPTFEHADAGVVMVNDEYRDSTGSADFLMPVPRV